MAYQQGISWENTPCVYHSSVIANTDVDTA